MYVHRIPLFLHRTTAKVTPLLCFRNFFRRHRISGEVSWDNPLLGGQGVCIGSPPCGVVVHQHPQSTEQPLGLAVGMHAIIIQPIYFFPSVKAIADAWEKHFDKKRKKNYWHNTITKEVGYGAIAAGARCLIYHQGKGFLLPMGAFSRKSLLALKTSMTDVWFRDPSDQATSTHRHFVQWLSSTLHITPYVDKVKPR